ncbi:hypothetical protein Ancab_001792 [Ancistrocladus abbreviatus]
MSTADYFPFFLPPTLLSLPLFLFLLFASAFAFHLSPGGLAWALSKANFHRSKPVFTIRGPSGLPLLGLAFTFTGSLTHRILAKLSRMFDSTPLMAFSIGLTRFIISSEPNTAKEILNSSAFADRPIKESAYGLLFHRAMGFAPFGAYWRNLRRISATHFFSPKRVASFGECRKAIGLKMVEEIKVLMDKNGQVEVRKVLHFGSLNNVIINVFGKSYEYGKREGEGEELERLVNEGYDLLGMFNWSDHFPLLGWLDLQGLRKRCKKLIEGVNAFVGKIVDEHRIKRIRENGGVVGVDNSEDDHLNDFVDVLLDLDAENRLSDSDMIAVLWEMIFRGTDTVTILLEWLLARMVLHPEIQTKAQVELDTTIGINKLVSDFDLPNLPYLLAIVKETLRMHPPGPLLSWARLTTHDTFVGPHFIPAGTTAMVNMWAITHDEKVWDDPDVFKPERFIEEDVNIMGSDLRLAPFGSGRRVCPGKAMGLVTVQLWLAQMLQNFNWVASEDGVDLTECLKLSMEMKNTLICKAIPRTG